MPLFQYKGRNQNGGLVSGNIEGDTRDLVASQLLEAGIMPVDIQEHVERPDVLSEIKDTFKSRKAPDLSELVMFCRQMYTLLKAGVPINLAVSGILQSIQNEYFVSVLKEIQSDIESGNDMTTAVSRHPKVFSPLFVSMVQVGESTGQLDEAFIRVAKYLEFDKETRQQIKSALRYPTFVLIAISIAMAVINIFVIPSFAKVFDKAKTELPLPTKFLMFTSELFVTYWPFMLMLLVGIIFGIKSWLRTEKGRLKWDEMKLNLPLVGSIIDRATLGRFARSFAMSISAGVPLTQALSVVSIAVNNEYVGKKIVEIRYAIEHGDSLSRAATATGMFTPLVLQMLSVGESSGAVDKMMFEVAEFYEREVEYDVKNLSATIEPVMIIVIGAMVLMLALGIFLPMWDMSSLG